MSDENGRPGRWEESPGRPTNALSPHTLRAVNRAASPQSSRSGVGASINDPRPVVLFSQTKILFLRAKRKGRPEGRPGRQGKLSVTSADIRLLKQRLKDRGSLFVVVVAAEARARSPPPSLRCRNTATVQD